MARITAKGFEGISSNSEIESLIQRCIDTVDIVKNESDDMPSNPLVFPLPDFSGRFQGQFAAMVGKIEVPFCVVTKFETMIQICRCALWAMEVPGEEYQ